MRVLLSLLALVVTSTAQAQEAPEVDPGDRMPDVAFDRLPATRLVVPGGEIAVGIAPGPLEVPRARHLRRDDGDGGACGGNVGQGLLQSVQLCVAVGSPAAAVE